MDGKKTEILEGYNLGKVLGKGAFSEVRLCCHKDTGKKYAVKIIDKRNIHANLGKGGTNKDEGLNGGLRWNFTETRYVEVKLLMRLMHPNIVKIHQYTETSTKTYMVIDYVPCGELVRHVLRRRNIPENTARKYFRSILSAVDHCHMSNIVHRDIKLDNMLINENDDIVITDFGFGKLLKSEDNEDLLGTFCGTPNYASAELVAGVEYSGVKTDVWSLGVVLFFMIAGRPPFLGKDITVLYSRIKRVEYTCPPYFSLGLKLLLSKIFVKDPDKRIDIEGLRNDQWVNYGYSEPPLRVYPVLCNKCDEKVEKFISGIFYNKGLTSFTFYNCVLKCRGQPGKLDQDIKFINPNDRNGTKQECNYAKHCSHILALTGTKPIYYDSEKNISSCTELYEKFRLGNNVYKNTGMPLQNENPYLKELLFTCRISAIGSIIHNNSNTLDKKILPEAMKNVVKSDSHSSYCSEDNLKDNFVLSGLGPHALNTLLTSQRRREPCYNLSLKPKLSSKKSRNHNSQSTSELTVYKLPDLVPVVFGFNPTLKDIENWHMIYKPAKVIRGVPFSSLLDITITGLAHAVFKQLYYYTIFTKTLLTRSGTVTRAGENYVIKCNINNGNYFLEVRAELFNVLFKKNKCGVMLKLIRGQPSLFKKFRTILIGCFNQKDLPCMSNNHV